MTQKGVICFAAKHLELSGENDVFIQRKKAKTGGSIALIDSITRHGAGALKPSGRRWRHFKIVHQHARQNVTLAQQRIINGEQRAYESGVAFNLMWKGSVYERTSGRRKTCEEEHSIISPFRK